MFKIKRLAAFLQAFKRVATSQSTLILSEEMSSHQGQHADGQSVALQAGRDVNIGLSYSDVKEIALDVYRANFYQLSGLAKQEAASRAEEITREFLDKLKLENPDGFRQANDPGFQYALYTAQMEHARSGNKDLSALLVDLLVDRTKHQSRDFVQIVLDESLSTAPKLTNSQLASLAAVFFLRYTQNNSLGTHESLCVNLDSFLAPLVASITKSFASFQHLEFSGCGAIAVTEISLEGVFGDRYKGLFAKGFDASAIEEQGVTLGNDPRVFIPCLNDQSKLQVKALNREGLDTYLKQLGVSTEDITRISALFDSNTMSHDEVREKCVALRSYMAEVFDFWHNSPAKNFTLTSVGIAIGHANIKRFAGEFADLSIWIN